MTNHDDLVEVHINGFELPFHIGDWVTIIHDSETPKKRHVITQMNIRRDGSWILFCSHGTSGSWMYPQELEIVNEQN